MCLSLSLCQGAIVCDVCVCVCHCVREPLYVMRVFVFVREPLKDEKAEDEKAALKDEIRKEEAGRENPQVRQGL